VERADCRIPGLHNNAIAEAPAACHGGARIGSLLAALVL
jgi:hypothetical protein